MKLAGERARCPVSVIEIRLVIAAKNYAETDITETDHITTHFMYCRYVTYRGTSDQKNKDFFAIESPIHLKH